MLNTKGMIRTKIPWDEGFKWIEHTFYDNTRCWFIPLYSLEHVSMDFN